MAISEAAKRNHDALFPGLPPQSTTSADTRFDRGLEAQKRIFGDRIDQRYARSPKDELHIQRFLSANCFGDYYTRTGLDLKTRELLTFAMLAALGGCESQLAGHLAGNLVVGNDRRVLIATITQLLPFIGYPRSLNALRIIDEGGTGMTRVLILRGLGRAGSARPPGAGAGRSSPDVARRRVRAARREVDQPAARRGGGRDGGPARVSGAQPVERREQDAPAGSRTLPAARRGCAQGERSPAARLPRARCPRNLARGGPTRELLQEVEGLGAACPPRARRRR